MAHDDECGDGTMLLLIVWRVMFYDYVECVCLQYFELYKV